MVGLLSVPPTIHILGWRRKLKLDDTYSPPRSEIQRGRRFFAAEALIFLLIPLFAAMMVRV